MLNKRGELKSNIITLVVTIIILVFGIIIISQMGLSNLPITTTSITNETGAWINSTGYTVSNASVDGFSNFIVLEARGVMDTNGDGASLYNPNSTGTKLYSFSTTSASLGDENINFSISGSQIEITDSGDKTTVSTDDENSLSANGGGGEFAGFKVDYAISESIGDIESLNITMRGRSFESQSGPPATTPTEFQLYIWNYTASSWEFLDEAIDAGNKVTVSDSIIANINNYVSDGQINIVVSNKLIGSNSLTELFYAELEVGTSGGSPGQVVISSGNYTTTEEGEIFNATETTWSDVELDYSYEVQESTVVSQSTTSSISGLNVFTQFIPIIILAIVASLIMSLIVVSFLRQGFR